MRPAPPSVLMNGRAAGAHFTKLPGLPRPYVPNEAQLNRSRKDPSIFLPILRMKRLLASGQTLGSLVLYSANPNGRARPTVISRCCRALIPALISFLLCCAAEQPFQKMFTGATTPGRSKSSPDNYVRLSRASGRNQYSRKSRLLFPGAPGNGGGPSERCRSRRRLFP